MFKARKKMKSAAEIAARRTKTRRRKVQFITRSEARQRAERHVINRLFKGALVRDGAEAGLSAYNVRREDTWVVYKKAPPVIQSSSVVVICKRTGRVLYEGSACDEG
jgi:hypothetical protein